MTSNKLKMGRDEKQYNFIDDRNEEYFVDEKVSGVTKSWKGCVTHETVQSNLTSQRKSSRG
jgi:hypothetical protein